MYVAINRADKVSITTLPKEIYKKLLVESESKTCKDIKKFVFAPKELIELYGHDISAKKTNNLYFIRSLIEDYGYSDEVMKLIVDFGLSDFDMSYCTESLTHGEMFVLPSGEIKELCN